MLLVPMPMPSGKVSLGDYAFHPVFPHLLCSETTGEAAWVRNSGLMKGDIAPLTMQFPSKGALVDWVCLV